MATLRASSSFVAGRSPIFRRVGFCGLLGNRALSTQALAPPHVTRTLEMARARCLGRARRWA
jgi:hypothetical protein